MTLTIFSTLRPSLRTRIGMRARAGFSILELTVVLVLVGIIMAIAGTKVSASITQQRVVRAASTIQTEMELAFALAGRNRAPMVISWTSSSSGMVLRVTDRTAAKEYGRTDLKN